MDSATYTITDLHFGYGSANVLRGLNLTFEPGLIHAIIGPNGSGKSTLLDLMTGHRTAAKGTITINNRPLNNFTPAALAQNVALVPQEFDFNFPFTVREAVLMGRHPHIPRFSRPSETDRAIVNSAMLTTDIMPLADRTLAELSGGEKQRTVLARALAQTTPVLLLDEPTSSMDIRHALTAMTELRRLAHAEHRTVVAVLHDLNLAAAYCDHIVILRDGQVAVQGNPAIALTPATIRDVFGVSVTVTGKTEHSDLNIAFNSKDIL